MKSVGKDFPLYTPGSDAWEKIWIEGFIVECTHCQHRQDKRQAAERGKWVSYVDNPEDTEYIGFHINQLYMPMIRKEDVISEKPSIHPTNSERAYFNEVLGEFYQGDSSPITLEELHDNCGEPDRKVRSFISPGQEDMVIMGIDYR